MTNNQVGGASLAVAGLFELNPAQRPAILLHYDIHKHLYKHKVTSSLIQILSLDLTCTFN